MSHNALQRQRVFRFNGGGTAAITKKNAEYLLKLNIPKRAYAEF